MDVWEIVILVGDDRYIRMIGGLLMVVVLFNRLYVMLVVRIRGWFGICFYVQLCINKMVVVSISKEMVMCMGFVGMFVSRYVFRGVVKRDLMSSQCSECQLMFCQIFGIKCMFVSILRISIVGMVCVGGSISDMFVIVIIVKLNLL